MAVSPVVARRRCATGPIPWRDQADRYLPQVAVAGDGRVDVLFHDRRADWANVMTQAYLATSTDAGAAFTNVPVSSAAFSSEVGPSLGELYGTDLCTRVRPVSGAAGAVAAWADTGWVTRTVGARTVRHSRRRLGVLHLATVGAVRRRGGGGRAGGMVGHETLHRLGREAATVRMAVVDKNPRRFTQP